MPLDGFIFELRSNGTKTNRDNWVYGYSRSQTGRRVDEMIAYYNKAVDSGQVPSPADPKKFAWTDSARSALTSRRTFMFADHHLRQATYRPFQRQHLYFDRNVIERTYQLSNLFPAGERNFGWYVVGPGSDREFAALAVAETPDLAIWGSSSGQFFARWRYEKVVGGEGTLSLATAFDDDAEVIDGYRRIDNITDHALTTFRAAYGDRITKDDIFFYVYGLLHSPDYRETYAADLKKMLPRVPLVTDPWPYVEAGRRLSELHLGYESVDPYPLAGLDDPAPTGDAAYDHFRVEKMAFAKVRDPETKKLVADRSTVVYNSRITLSGIPEDAYRYQLGSRSAIEWILDRYQVKVDGGPKVIG